MVQWKTLTLIAQVKKNDAVRMVMGDNSGKHWIYIVEKVSSNEIYLSGGEHYPSSKIISQEELDQEQFEFASLKNLHFDK